MIYNKEKETFACLHRRSTRAHLANRAYGTTETDKMILKFSPVCLLLKHGVGIDISNELLHLNMVCG